MEKGIPAGLTAREGRRFSFLVGGAFLILGGIVWWRDHHTLATLFGGLGMLLLAAGSLVPEKLGSVYRAWMLVGQAISRVTTPIFMGIVYFIVIMPVGLGMRLLGRNPIRHRPSAGSYWFKRDQPHGNMTDQF